MHHAKIAAIGIAWLACLAACALPANADDDDIAKGQKLIRVVCSAGRMGVALEDVADFFMPESTPAFFKNIWEGCRQESVKDLSCYPFTLTKD
jgi:hypothetical protein